MNRKGEDRTSTECVVASVLYYSLTCWIVKGGTHVYVYMCVYTHTHTYKMEPRNTHKLSGMVVPYLGILTVVSCTNPEGSLHCTF